MHTKIVQEEMLDRGGSPTLREILRHLSFSPLDSSIKLNGARMILQRASYNARLRDELVACHGLHHARVILTRLGYQAGIEDAKLVQESWPELDLGDAFTAGTRLHNANGVVRVETLFNDFDFSKRKFSSEFLWHGSAEATEFLDRHGPDPQASCWSQLGYASGYASHFFEDLVVYKEPECTAAGHAHCRIVGRYARDWGDNDDVVRLYRDEVLKPGMPRALRQSPAPLADNTQLLMSDIDSVLSAPFQARLDQLIRARIPLMFCGAHGTGKLAAARYVQAMSNKQVSVLRLVCSTVSASDLDEVLLSATVKHGEPVAGSRAGVVVLLSDIDSLCANVQSHLLGLLEAGEPLSTTLISTTTQTSGELRETGQLRSDLFYKLSMAPIHFPSLQDRSEDLPSLALASVQQLAQELGRDDVPALTPAAIELLGCLSFPGNFPELQALLFRCLLLTPIGEAVNASTINNEQLGSDQVQVTEGQSESFMNYLNGQLSDGGFCVDQMTRSVYMQAMKKAGGNIAAAARLLGITRAQLAYRLK